MNKQYQLSQTDRECILQSTVLPEYEFDATLEKAIEARIEKSLPTLAGLNPGMACGQRFAVLSEIMVSQYKMFLESEKASHARNALIELEGVKVKSWVDDWLRSLSTSTVQ